MKHTRPEGMAMIWFTLTGSSRGEKDLLDAGTDLPKPSWIDNFEVGTISGLTEAKANMIEYPNVQINLLESTFSWT
jgi:hypothetical protein